MSPEKGSAHRRVKEVLPTVFQISNLFVFLVLLLFTFASNVLAFISEPIPRPRVDRNLYTTDLFSGSATYSYPIVVPVGTNNLTPDIYFSYNSSGVRDITTRYGIGWMLAQDFVERDTNYTTNNLSDDKFKLHFKGRVYDLVYVSSEDRYHTEEESNFHITKISGGNNQYSNYWQVITPEGIKYRMGYVSESEQGCVGKNFAVGWYLDLITDTHANKITYEYSESNGSTYISKIKYNNDESRIIDFTYENNPYERQTYTHGCPLADSSRLSSIQVKINTNLIRQYSLSYFSSDNNQSLLSSIVEKGSDGTSSLPVTTFGYMPEVKNWSVTAEKWIDNLPLDATLEMNDVRLVDINGDALSDIVQSRHSGSNTNWRVLLNTGGGWQSDWTTWVTLHENIRLQLSNVTLVDVTGDNLPDIVQSTTNNPGETWKVWKNSGNGWSTNSETWINGANLGLNLEESSTIIVDVNGDGLSDILKTHIETGSNPEWKVFKNTGSNWNTNNENWIAPSNMKIGESNVQLLDVDGDNLPDLIKTTNSGSNATWNVYKNTGSGWKTTPEIWINNANIDAYLGKADTSLSDVNGDGLVDIVRAFEPGNSFNTWRVFMNQGNKWSISYVDWVNDENINTDITGSIVRLADVTGDGLPDIVKGEVTPNGGQSPYVTWSVFKNNDKAANLLKTINTSQGGKITFEYTKSAQFDNDGGDLPDLPFNIWVVTHLVKDNGINGSQKTEDTTTYSYASGAYNFVDKEFRGFGEVNTVESNGSKKKYVFHQDNAKKGRLIEMQHRDSTSNLYAEIEQTWTSANSNGVYRVDLTSEKQYTYDGTSTGPKINQTDYTYDGYGNVTKKSERGDMSTIADDRFTYYEYAYNTTDWIVGAPKRVYKHKNDDTTKIAESWFYYDSATDFNTAPTKGDLTKEVKWLSGGTNPVTLFTYDIYGNQLTVTDANNHTTTTVYDTATKTYPTSVTNAKNQVTTYSYDLGTGNLLSKTDPNSFVTAYEYDVFGRVIKEIQPYDTSSLPTVAYTYSFDGTAPESTKVSKREVSGQSGTLDVYTFVDGFGRMIQTRSEAENIAQNIVTDTFYHPNGQVEKVTVPFFATLSTNYASPSSVIKHTLTTYDAIGRPTQVTNPDTTYRQVSYDHWKNTETNERGKVTKKTFNAFNKIVEVEEVNGGTSYVTSYTYDANDNLTKIIDAVENEFTFTYDTLGRKTAQNDPDMGNWTYAYDGVGNITSQTDNKSVTTTRTYDELNRVTLVNYPTDTDVTYTYDGNSKVGTLTSVTDAAGTVAYTYDNRLRKTAEARTISGTTKTTSYAYDAANRVVTQTNPDTTVSTYAFNTQGEVESLNGIVSNIDYNSLNKVTKKTFANGLSTDYTYSTNDFRLNQIRTAPTSGTAVFDSSYTYDAIGNISSITDNILSKTHNYGYDDLDRLTSASVTGDYNYAYTYSPIGNMTKFTNNGVDTNYTYGSNTGPHALTGSSTATQTLAPHNIFEEGLGTDWEDWSWGSTNSFTDTSNPYAGTKNISWTVNSAYGGLYLHKTGGVDTTGYATLSFALKASQSGQNVQVGLYDNTNTAIGTPLSLANYGGQPVSSSYTVYTIPLSDLGGSNRVINGILIQDSTGASKPAMFVDNISIKAATQTPTTTYLYDDAVASNWSNWSWNSTVDVNATTAPQVGTKHISWTANAGYAGFYLHNGSGINTTNYASLTFALRGTQSGQTYQVLLYDDTDTPIGSAVPLTNYGGSPSTTAYTVYTIPLSVLGGTNRQINGVVIQDNTGGAQPAVYIDSLGFVASSGVTTTSYTYDANGNMTSDGTKCYEYNEANKLKKVKSCSNNQTIAEYVYDYAGIRLIKKAYTNGAHASTTTSWTPSFETKAIVGGATETINYYYANKEIVARKNSDGSIHYYHNDHLGSVSVVTNQLGAIVELTKYDPWGLIKTGGTQTKHGYTGQEYDSESGLNYYKARYYGSSFHRFTQPDPFIQNIYDPQALNRYAYTRNNPLKYTDPSGHFFAGLQAIWNVITVINRTNETSSKQNKTVQQKVLGTQSNSNNNTKSNSNNVPQKTGENVSTSTKESGVRGGFFSVGMGAGVFGAAQVSHVKDKYNHSALTLSLSYGGMAGVNSGFNYGGTYDPTAKTVLDLEGEDVIQGGSLKVGRGYNVEHTIVKNEDGKLVPNAWTVGTGFGASWEYHGGKSHTFILLTNQPRSGSW